MSAAETLAQIAAECAACTKCGLHAGRKKAVPGVGPAEAEILFIGEGPGYNENEQGLPFVGQAGKLLDEMLASIGLERAQVFITNVVKCRPPANRDPQPDELAACNEYLERQIAAINPKVIVTLGRFSMAKFLPNARISAVHGQAHTINGRLVVPFFHPAAALHQPDRRPALAADFARLPALITAAAHTEPPHPPDEPDKPRQLTLF